MINVLDFFKMLKNVGYYDKYVVITIYNEFLEACFAVKPIDIEMIIDGNKGEFRVYSNEDNPISLKYDISTNYIYCDGVVDCEDRETGKLYYTIDFLE